MMIYNHNISDLLILHLSELSKLFHLTYILLSFVFITSSILQAVCFAFCRSFSLKVPIMSSPLMPFDRYVHDALFLTFFNDKYFFSPIWFITFWKYVFILWDFCLMVNLKFRLLSINFDVLFNTFLWSIINRIHFDWSMNSMMALFQFFRN